MTLGKLFSVLRTGSFKICNNSNDSILATGFVYFYGSGTDFLFDERCIERTILLNSLVSDIYVCKNNTITVYVALEAE